MTAPFRILADDSLTGAASGGSINAYEPGQSVDFSASVDVAGVLTDASTIALTIHPGSGGTDIASTPSHDGTGLYSATVPIPPMALPGVWVARWTIPGAAVAERRFVVKALAF